ncbi:MAG: hypothetical protein QOJ86_3089 [Bradyrhizobium sp.]|jgi:hypothetical protein|nr:hypothetical protein [Bradyrhizobium sp.]
MLLATGVAATADALLSIPEVPWEAKAVLDILGVVYGGYMTFRWMTSFLMPLEARIAMSGVNTAVWLPQTYLILKEIVGYLAHGPWPFEHTHLAFLPFALSIELIVRRLIKKIEDLKAKNAGGEEEEDEKKTS